jgi:hypothetical protein
LARGKAETTQWRGRAAAGALGEVGEKGDEKAAVEEGNSAGFILEVGLAIPRFGRGRAARALEQPGLQGALREAIPCSRPLRFLMGLRLQANN